jgi:hypothetical protein
MTNIKLQDNQKSAIETYVHSSIEEFSKLSKIDHIVLDKTGFTFQINGVLRAGLSLAKESEDFCLLLDSAFGDYTTTEDIIVFRASNYKEMLRYIEGDRYFDLGYMSTSKSTESIQRFFENPKIGYSPVFLKITIPSGSNVLDLNSIVDFNNTTYEQEILIKRNSIFKIISLKEIESNEIQEYIGLEVCETLKKITTMELIFVKYLS